MDDQEYEKLWGHRPDGTKTPTLSDSVRASADAMRDAYRDLTRSGTDSWQQFYSTAITEPTTQHYTFRATPLDSSGFPNRDWYEFGIGGRVAGEHDPDLERLLEEEERIERATRTREIRYGRPRHRDHLPVRGTS